MLVIYTYEYNLNGTKYQNNNSISLAVKDLMQLSVNLNKHNEHQKLVKEYKEKRISSKNRQIKSSNLPERNNLNSVVYWKELKKNMMKSKEHEKKSSSKVASISTSLGRSDMPVMNMSVGTLS